MSVFFVPIVKPTSRNRRQYLVYWRGRGREENEWLFDNELSNAADAVQDLP